MYTKITMTLGSMLLLGGCAMGNVSMGASDAGDAHSLCMAQEAQRQMNPQQELRFMHRCMAGYGYGPHSTKSKPFTVPMPNHDQKQQ